MLQVLARRFAKFFHAAHSYEFSLINDADPGAELFCKLKDVGAKEHCTAPTDEVEKPCFEFPLDERVKVEERLVHEEHSGFMKQRCRECDFFLLTFRETHAHGLALFFKSEEFYPPVHVPVLRQSPDRCRKMQVFFNSKEGGGYSISGTMPMAAFTEMGSEATSIPITEAVPEVGGI